MTYHLTYSVTPHPEGIEKEAVPVDHGACTALIVASVLYQADGSYSITLASFDGRTATPLPDAELWKAWTLLAKHLSESNHLAQFKKVICGVVFDSVMGAITTAGKPEPGT